MSDMIEAAMAEAIRQEMSRSDMLMRDSRAAQQSADAMRYVRAAMSAAKLAGYVLVHVDAPQGGNNP